MTEPGAVLDRAPDDRVQVLDPDGEVVAPDLVPALDDETLVAFYRDMRFSRRFDERMIALQRRGEVGTYPSLAGQEGAQVGSTHALAEDDVVFPQYREHGVLVVRGMPPEYPRYWMGYERGNEAIADRGVFPLNIGVGSHLPHAVGWSWAAKLRGDDRVGVVHFGDGATSEGDFHEAMNFAGVFDTPTVFVCNNNQWAISVPRERQTASATLAGKAAAYGFDGVQVDGMDPLATYVVTRAARERALAPDGARPTLIEAVQYRFGAHTTADDPSVYRDEAEVERWRERDPIPRLEAFLRDRGVLDDNRVATVEAAVEDAVDELLEEVTAVEPDPDAMFEHDYAALPDRPREQRAALRGLRERHGDDALLEDR